MADESVAGAIEEFVKSCRRPAVVEPGEPLLVFAADCLEMERHRGGVRVSVWNDERNLTRRVTRILSASGGRMEVEIERFGKKRGTWLLLDQARGSNNSQARRGERMAFAEQFRLFLARQFGGWRVVELSAHADLEHSLSPSYPRALVVRGRSGWAAIASPPGAEPNGALSFGLIWFDYLRRRERRLTIEGLALILPEGSETTTCLRLRWLNPKVLRQKLFVCSADGAVRQVEIDRHANLDTRLEVLARPAAVPEWLAPVASLDSVDQIANPSGEIILSVRGIAFARVGKEGVELGVRGRARAGPERAGEARRLAENLSRIRSYQYQDRQHSLWRRRPEAWLESQVRRTLRQVDATLRQQPLYGQVPAFAGGERGVMDLLSVDHEGRLAVLELKASADLHLPLQALDYWMRVAWHAAKGDFSTHGYFPGISLKQEPPRLLLISPALEFHPAAETILRFFSPEIAVERVGLALEWQQEVRVLLRLSGARRPY
jgi:hypothetical protein